MNQNRGEVRSGVADVEIDDNLEFCGHGRFLSIVAALAGDVQKAST
jgi:hypothetical protein